MKVSSWYLSKIVTSDEKVSFKRLCLLSLPFLIVFSLLIRYGTYRGWKSQGDTHQSWQCLQQRRPVPTESQPFISLTLGPITPTEGSWQLENVSQEQTSLIQTVMVELPTQRQVALIISVFQTSRLPQVTQERMKINPPCLTLGLWTTPK